MSIEHEPRLVTLEIDSAKTALSVDHLARAVEKLDSTVQSLRDTMNQGRGALWGIGTSAAVIGGLASYAAHRIFGVG
jgi:hypothetical protein